MQKTVRYYIHKSGEQPSVRTVPVADQRPVDQPRRAAELRPTASTGAVQATPVRRLREALKRSVR